MKQIIFLCTILLAFNSGYAQTASPDTAYSYQMKPVIVSTHWKNDTDRYHYNQTKYYITTILPYVNASTQLITEINTNCTNNHYSKGERRRYIKSRERELKTTFEDKIKSLNVTQADLLIKLVSRQNHINVMDLISEYKNDFTATKWQLWAKMNGMNLNKTYNPNEEAVIECIMEELGYPLPESYTPTNNSIL